MKRLLTTIIILTSLVPRSMGQETSAYSFSALDLTGNLFSACTIFQDNEGYLWVGTENGILKYDGNTSVDYRFIENDSTSLCHNHVNILLYDPDRNRFIAGTDIGASVYDFRTDSFRSIPSCGYRHVKSVLRHNGDFWFGTTDGLLHTDGDMETIGTYGRSQADFIIPSSHIACGKEIGGRLYFGAYDHFYRISPDGSPEIFPLPCNDIHHNNLVLDITEDRSDKEKIWLGTERGLIHYSLRDSSYRIYLQNHPVKAFMYSDSGELWIGTDYGLFLMGRNGELEHFRHDTEDDGSLSNNVVWSIFQDRAGEIFIGTDHGVSMVNDNSRYLWQKLEDITGSNYGLDIRTITTGANGDLWLGGFDGLVRKQKNGKVTWYNSDTRSSGNRIAHNKIRAMHDDGDRMWIVSDGGLDMIDCISGKVRHFALTYSDGRYVSDWMYSIDEDDCGRLWIGSYEGLLCVGDKKRLLEGPSPYKADIHLSASTEPSLDGNAVMDIENIDRYIAIRTNGNIDLYDTRNGSIRHMYCPDGHHIYSMRPSGDTLYLATEGGAYMMTPESGFSHIDGSKAPVNIVVADKGYLWTVSDKEVSRYDMSSGKWVHSLPEDKVMLCGASDGKGHILFGSVNGYCVFDRERFGTTPASEKVSITGLYINGSRVHVGKEYGGNIILPKNLGSTDSIILEHDQNSFSLEFSSFIFSGSNGSYSYRLRGFEDNWQQTSKDASATFLNIPAGKYTFEVRPSGAEGSGSTASMRIRIRPVWYLTPIAYILYALLFMTACAMAYYYIRMKHQLQIEHMEREKALKSADTKTEFLANVTHEFKSPLSIITGFVGRMITSEADAMKTKELRTIQQNAEKIQLLLEQMVKYNENSCTDLFMPAATSLQDLVKDVYERYEEAFRDKDISTRFVADDIRYIFMTDRMKMESALQNLLSNALKFTPHGGSVLVSVSVGEETEDMVYADIRIEDTGCGIDPDELLHIFERRYLAPSGQGINVNGSGIGLSLVREIVEMHKGKVWATSEPGKGTCFTVRLSTMKADSFILKDADDDNFTLHSLSKVWQHDRKPRLLLVEDNPDIRDFITASLGKDYTFIVADEGRKGLDFIEKEKIDLVITDISMPDGMDGLTMSRHIRNSLETAFLPIIVLTGNDDMKTRIRSFEYADAFISKPFSLGYLNNRIIQLLIKHEQYLDKMKRQQMLVTKVEEVHSPDEKFLQEMVDIMTRHMDDPEFSAAVLCGESRYSQKQTYRKIKQLTGMSIVEFIRDARLRKAAMYLEQGKLTVNEVMYKVGFTTASYFAKCFKEKYGVSPSEYRPEK